MYIEKLTIRGIRSIENFSMEFKASEAPGWHVVLGDNGAGKSSVIRSLALIFAGGPNVSATRQDWQTWLRANELSGTVEAIVHRDDDLDNYVKKGRQSGSMTVRADFIRSDQNTLKDAVQLNFSGSTSTANRSIWSDATGWFSASFGPFRRFTGGDYAWDRLFVSPEYRRVAGHLSAFGEDVALTEALRWLQQLHVRSLESSDPNTHRIRDAIREFVNRSGLLPHGAVIDDISSQRVNLRDGEGNLVPIEQMSDGYRSVLSLTLELIRQMFAIYGEEVAIAGIDSANAVVILPGVVAIDEIDAHLHPAWQARIGEWFVERFPNVQFIVSTHSPIICRAARHGSIWRLPTPGSRETAGRVTGQELDRLISGNILEAMSTDFFGQDVERADFARADLSKLARLNKRMALGEIDDDEIVELNHLKASMPTSAANIS